jgi:hypothetical protein
LQGILPLPASELFVENAIRGYADDVARHDPTSAGRNLSPPVG